MPGADIGQGHVTLCWEAWRAQRLEEEEAALGACAASVAL